MMVHLSLSLAMDASQFQICISASQLVHSWLEKAEEHRQQCLEQGGVAGGEEQKGKINNFRVGQLV